MKKEGTDFSFEDSNKIKQEPSDYNKEAKPKRSKWIKWLLNIIDNIVTALT